MIQTADVHLRRFEPRDVEQLYAFRNDSEIVAALSGFSCGYSREDLLEWIEWHRLQKDEQLWAICDDADDRCIGQVGLYRIDQRARAAEFGIIIGDPAWQGRGLGPAVSRAVFAFAFDQLNLNRISAEIAATNQRSLDSYLKLGMRQEGLFRQHDYRDGRYIDVIPMAILAEDWRNNG